MNIVEKKNCFVIMPFSQTNGEHTEEYWTKHYNTFLKPLIELSPLIAHRSSPLHSDILEQIIKDLITSPIVVADLTDYNPNVFWELGVRQSFKHSTITIAQQGTTLPFDIARKATLFYDIQQPNDHNMNVDFTKNLTHALLDCLNNPESPDSPVLQSITGRGTLYQIIGMSETLRKITALLEEIKFNCELLEIVSSLCNQNSRLRAQKKENECKIISAQLRLICLENLLVNRYLYVVDSFYEHAHRYFVSATAFNEQILIWHNSSDTEEYLLRQFISLKPLIEDFNVLVDNESKHLSSIY